MLGVFAVPAGKNFAYSKSDRDDWRGPSELRVLAFIVSTSPKAVVRLLPAPHLMHCVTVFPLASLFRTCEKPCLQTQTARTSTSPALFVVDVPWMYCALGSKHLHGPLLLPLASTGPRPGRHGACVADVVGVAIGDAVDDEVLLEVREDAGERETVAVEDFVAPLHPSSYETATPAVSVQ